MIDYFPDNVQEHLHLLRQVGIKAVQDGPEMEPQVEYRSMSCSN